MKTRMNKKGVAPLIWILIVAAGLFLAQQAGLFAVFTPSVGQPPGASSLVNPVYYGDAVSDFNFVCELQQSVVFRSTFTLSSSSLPGRDNEIAVDEGGVNLKAFERTSGSSSSQPNRCETKGSLERLLPGGLKLIKESSSRYWLCDGNREGIAGTGTAWDRYDPGQTSISTSRNALGGNEILGDDVPISGEQKFSCRDGNVVLQSCNGFLNDFTIQQDCAPSQACEFFDQFQTPDGPLPAVKCSGNYIPNQNLCSGDTLFTTDSNAQLSINQCGFVCSNGECIECQDGASRCAQLPGTQTDIEICIRGQWAEQVDSVCIGAQQCTESGGQAQCTSEFTNGQQRCSGKQPQIFDGSTQTWSNEGDACDLSCVMEGTDATCFLECGDIGFSCDVGILQHCTNQDRDNDLETLGVCTSGVCTADGISCEPVRPVGERYCSEGNILVSIPSGNENDLNGGAIGLLESSCSNGCEISNGAPRCTPAPGCEGNEGLSICTDSFTRKTCSSDGQSFVDTESCSETFTDGFCTVEGNVGVCQKPQVQCEGTSVCTEGGIIRSCDNGIIGAELNSCNNLGCTTDSNGLPQCNDECSQLDAFQCSDGDSYQCILDSSTDQLTLQIQTSCGNEGCNPSNGKCLTSGDPDSFICVGDTIHSTDENGFLDQLVNQCGVAGDSYCSEGIGFCKFCELNSLSCEPNAWVQCVNEQTGDTQTLATCEVGCSVIGGQFNCDNLAVTVSESQNFFADENLIITLTLKGDKSENGVATSATARIEGVGVDQTESTSSPSNGVLTFGFGTKPLGQYTVTVDLPEFNKQEVITVRVTNDFIINLFGTQTILDLPGQTPSTEIESFDSNGNAPDDVIVSTSPQGISVVSTPSGIEGRWTLSFTGESGIYTIGLSPVKDGVTLDEQNINVELRSPQLQVTTNIPDSSTPGNKEYDINIVGPTLGGTTTGISPDTISATISHSSQQAINLLEIGSGTFTFQHDLSELGTYTVSVEATKEGYDSVSFSKQIEISQSGDITPPSSTQSGTGAGTGAGSPGAGGDTDVPQEPDQKLLIFIVVGIIVYFAFIRGKK